MISNFDKKWFDVILNFLFLKLHVLISYKLTDLGWNKDYKYKMTLPALFLSKVVSRGHGQKSKPNFGNILFVLAGVSPTYL